MEIDLHGLKRDGAIARLARDLAVARLRGIATVRIVTGRGHSRKGADQGILRNLVPGWLAGARFRPLVARVEPEPGNPGALRVHVRIPERADAAGGRR